MTEVSVIVPVYNVRPFLPACVASVRGQTMKDLELILVDDGSTDGSGELCDTLAKKDARIRVLHTENGGQGRRGGISRAGFRPCRRCRSGARAAGTTFLTPPTEYRMQGAKLHGFCRAWKFFQQFIGRIRQTGGCPGDSACQYRL